MSFSNLSVDGEFRYVVQWFNEWSELQRDDFVYVLVDYLKSDGANGDEGTPNVNGVVNSLADSDVQDRPMNLYQCRVKLFRKWNVKWPNEFKTKLQEKIAEIDPKVGEKVVEELNNPHPKQNGIYGYDPNRPLTVEERAHAVVFRLTRDILNDIIDQTLAACQEEHMAEMLRQETAVDDDDDQAQRQVTANSDCNPNDTNGNNESSAAVTTIAVNAAATVQQEPQPIIEPEEQVEANASASVIATAAAASPKADVVPVA